MFVPLRRSASLRSVWSALPADFTALGYRGDARHLYGRLVRPWAWQDGAPHVGREARAFASDHISLGLPRERSRQASSDGSTKLLIELDDGAAVEAVHMPRDTTRPRVTLCISSQVGCAMGCTFCATGAMGLTRHLRAHEIVGQVALLFRAFADVRPETANIVFMGMGEPLHNVEEVIRAIRVLTEPAGLGLAPSRITVSTAGLVPGIDRLAQAEPRPLLALSLNATTDDARQRTMPVTRAWGLADLRAALERWPRRPHEKITIEYVLLRGENDSLEDAERLAAWVRGIRHVLNVIPYNTHGAAPFEAPQEDELQTFVKRLQDRGCLVTVRRSRGADVAAACGQLVSDSSRLRRPPPPPT